MEETEKNVNEPQTNQEPAQAESPGLKAAREENERLKREARKWEERAKANKNAAPILDEKQAKLAETQEQIANLQAKLEQFETENERMRAEQARREAVATVAANTNIPAAVIANMQGSTVEELTAAANVVKQSIPVYPTNPNDGRGGHVQGVTKDDVLSIKNDKERRRAILENLDKFKEN